MEPHRHDGEVIEIMAAVLTLNTGSSVCGDDFDCFTIVPVRLDRVLVKKSKSWPQTDEPVLRVKTARTLSCSSDCYQRNCGRAFGPEPTKTRSWAARRNSHTIFYLLY